MTTSHDVSRLLREAAQTESIENQQLLVEAATKAQHEMYVKASQANSIDLANTAIAEAMTPVAVYSHITAASDWLGQLSTDVDTADMANQITAQAALWYERVSPEVKADAGEFAEQVRGRAHVVASGWGQAREHAYTDFVEQLADLRSRDLRTGAIKESGSTLPQVGEQGMPSNTFANGDYDQALPLEATTSERAPQIQELEANNGSGASQDVTRPQSPSADQANGDAGTQENGSSMTNTQRSASRQHTAYSGLDQIQQTVSPDDTHAAPTPLNPEVAFPMTWDLNAPGQSVNDTIAETEKQLAERDQRKGASRRAAALAKKAYDLAMREAGYEPAKTAGQDDSGWAGDMGAGGYQPGTPPQGAPGHNLGQPDPVYGYGGDQGDQQLKPYGASEADDITSNPGMNYAPGDDTHYDVGGRQMATGARNAEDPEIAKAQKFIAQRQAWLERQV
jgi:hypothetical protein